MKHLWAHVAPLRWGKSLLLALAVVAMLSTGASAARGGYTFHDGDRVQVLDTGGMGLRVRSGPSFSYNAITTMPEYKTVTVLAGPVWANGYGWYKVTGFDSRGTTGWSCGWWLFGVGYNASASSNTRTVTRRVSTSTTTSARAVSRPTPVYTGPTYRVLATGYNGAEPGGGGFYMRNGQHVYWGAVAVDPNYIPLGTRMYISGFGNKVFVASDTGGAIKGWRIDIWFPTVSQAQDFAAQWHTVTLIR